MKFLTHDGLLYFWRKVKDYVDTKDTATNTKITTLNSTVSTLNTTVSGKANSTHTHTKSQITDFPTSMTPSAHNQAAGTITAGTLAGQVLANASATATIGTAQVRNIYAGTSDMVAGTTPLTTGTIYIVYE